MAFEAGYRVTKIYRCYTWEGEEMDSDLFRNYVQKWMQLKYISSGKNFCFFFHFCHAGWPAHIKNPDLTDMAREELKAEYVKEANKRYGINFNVADVEQNPGKKYLSKQALNSLCNENLLINLAFYY